MTILLTKNAFMIEIFVVGLIGLFILIQSETSEIRYPYAEEVCVSSSSGFSGGTNNRQRCKYPQDMEDMI